MSDAPCDDRSVAHCDDRSVAHCDDRSVAHCDDRSVALLIVGHGSKSANADDVLPYYVDLFRADFEEVLACYLEQEPRIDEALGRIKADRVFVMPLLVAHGYHTKVTIPRALGIEAPHGFSAGKEIFLLEPLGRSGHIAELIKERIGEAKK